MEKFIACICDNDLNQLVVSGTPEAEDLLSAWSALFLEYCDLVEDAESKYRIFTDAKIRFLESKISIVTSWVELLRMVYLPNVIQALKTLEFDYDFNWDDQKEFNQDLNKVEADLRPLRIELALLKEEFTLFSKGQSTEKEVDRKYFQTIFIRLNKYMGYEAIHGQTKVSLYCAALRDFVSSNINK